jgi:HNH endonuclease
MTITSDRLRELLAYDPSTGVFTRRVRTSTRTRVGDVAGCLKNKGRIAINADGKLYQSHRLAWLYVYGEWPKHHIDHIDGDPSNNRIANLRDVISSVNQQNRKCAQANNASGLLGVSPYRGRWRATICINGACRLIGRFDTPEQAHAAYLEVKRQLHTGCTI